MINFDSTCKISEEDYKDGILLGRNFTKDATKEYKISYQDLMNVIKNLDRKNTKELIKNTKLNDNQLTHVIYLRTLEENNLSSSEISDYSVISKIKQSILEIIKLIRKDDGENIEVETTDDKTNELVIDISDNDAENTIDDELDLDISEIESENNIFNFSESNLEDEESDDSEITVIEVDEDKENRRPLKRSVQKRLRKQGDKNDEVDYEKIQNIINQVGVSI